MEQSQAMKAKDNPSPNVKAGQAQGNPQQQPNGQTLAESSPSNPPRGQMDSSNVSNYHKTRKLSGPENKVDKDVLSKWRNKFEGQQTEIFEEEEEEED